MKFNYKKVASILASAVMLSSTIGFAAAASYPAPFVQSGASNAAIVYGSAAAASIDMTNAVDIIKKDLDSKVTVTTTASTPTGGEVYTIQKPSVKFHLGDGIKDVVSGTVTKDNLPKLLADGTYMDADNNEYGYTQKITLANLSYQFFEDSDYKDYIPALGMIVNSGDNVLNYTMDFSSLPAFDSATLVGTDLEILGKSYYVSAVVANTSITLLDSAQKDVINEKESRTITLGDKSYDVSVDGISETKAYLTINGESVGSNGLSVGQTKRLKDGSFVGIRGIIYNAKESGISKVEVSIGSGKLKIANASDVEINDEAVSGLTGYLTPDSTGHLKTIKLVWKTDDKYFVANGKDVTLPGFNSIKLSYGGMTTPSEVDTFRVKNNGDSKIELQNFPLKDSVETIPLMYGSTSTGNLTGIGKDATHQLRTNTTVITFDADTDSEFIATYASGKDFESYMMRATNFKTDSGVNKTTFQKRVNSDWVTVKEDAAEGDEVTVGNVDFTVGDVMKLDNTVLITASTNTNFNTIYTTKGLKIYLPYAGNTTAPGAINLTQGGSEGDVGVGHNPTKFYLYMSEADKDGNLGLGKNLTASISFSGSNPKIEVSSISGATEQQDGDGTNLYQGYVNSPLASNYEYDKSGDQYSVTVNYNGEETYGNFFITASSASVGGESAIKVFKDTDVDSFKDFNLIVVGGSCVNQVAVKLLGGTDVMCGEDFTKATGANIGANQYIIKTFDSPYGTGKVATLVAGYNADDTKNAMTKLVSGVSTDVGQQTIGPAAS